MWRTPDPRPLIGPLRLSVALTGLFLLALAHLPLLPRELVPGGPLGALAARLAFMPACHQIPARCLSQGGASAALCLRCSGLILGGILAALAAGAIPATTRDRARLGLGLGLLPMLADVAAQAAGLYVSNPLRLATGTLAGAAALAAVFALARAEAAEAP